MARCAMHGAGPTVRRSCERMAGQAGASSPNSGFIMSHPSVAVTDCRGHPRAPMPCIRISGSGARRGRSCSGSCRSASSITPPTRSRSSALMWLLVPFAWPAHLERASRANDSRGRRLRLSGGRPLHRHLRVPRVARGGRTPRTFSSPAARSARRCSCCRCSAPT